MASPCLRRWGWGGLAIDKDRLTAAALRLGRLALVSCLVAAGTFAALAASVAPTAAAGPLRAATAARGAGSAPARQVRVSIDGLAAVHGYVLEPEIFDVLEGLKPGRGGEIWLSDAVTQLARQGAPVWAVELSGVRYDTGDRAGYVTAFVDAALLREDLASALRAHLRQRGWRPPGDR